MRKLSLFAIAFGLLPLALGCNKPIGKKATAEPVANPVTEPAADPAPTGELSEAYPIEAVDPTVDLGPPPHLQPKFNPKVVNPKPPKQVNPPKQNNPNQFKPKVWNPKLGGLPHMGSKPYGYFKPYAGHPFHGGMNGQWAKFWLGHHHHGHHYLYGLYMPTWRGYTFRVWNGRWLYWSPADYCWYRYDAVLQVFIPLNPDGTDAIDPAPPMTSELVPPSPPPPPTPPTPEPPPPPPSN